MEISRGRKKNLTPEKYTLKPLEVGSPLKKKKPESFKMFKKDPYHKMFDNQFPASLIE
jgi:hypothetical protein